MDSHISSDIDNHAILLVRAPIIHCSRRFVISISMATEAAQHILLGDRTDTLCLVYAVYAVEYIAE